MQTSVLEILAASASWRLFAVVWNRAD